MTCNERLSLSLYSWSLTTGCRAAICRCLFALGRTCCLLQSKERCRQLLIQHPEYQKDPADQRPINTRQVSPATAATDQGQPASSDEATSLLQTKPDDWSDTLWHIYQERYTRHKPDPFQDLIENKKKTKHWSWQWFPTVFRELTSPERKQSAFKNLDELMTYYRSDILRGEAIELAELAVQYPMNNASDEKVLTRSLLTCLFAAKHCKDEQGVQRLQTLIQTQNTKDYKDYRPKIHFDKCLDDVNTWLEEQNCTPLTRPTPPIAPQQSPSSHASTS